MPSTSRLKSSDSLAQWAQKTNQLADQVDVISATSGSIGGSGYTSGQIAAYGTSWINYTPGADLSSAISGGNINFTITPAAFTNKSEITAPVIAANDYLLIYEASSTSVKKVHPQYIATPGGSTTFVQFNNAGAFDGSSGFTFSAGVLTVPTGLTINTNNLYVAGGKVGIGNVIPATPLDVTGNITTSTAYYVGGTSVLSATTLGGGVVSSSLTSVGTLSSLTVSGTPGTLTVSGAGVFSSTLASASLSTTGFATVGTTLGVTGAATLSSTLGVTGAATFSSSVTVTGVLKGRTNVTVQSTSLNPVVAQTTYNVTSTGITLTLPASPTTGDSIGFRPASSSINSYTVARNTNTIMGLSSDLTVDSAAPFDLLYTGSGWVLA